MSVYQWEYVGSLIPAEDTLLVNGQWMTPTPVDDLPDPAERGALVARLVDAETGLRWVMLYH